MSFIRNLLVGALAGAFLGLLVAVMTIPGALAIGFSGDTLFTTIVTLAAITATVGAILGAILQPVFWPLFAGNVAMEDRASRSARRACRCHCLGVRRAFFRSELVE